MQTCTGTAEVVVSAGKDRILDRLSDPFLFTGAMGHITIIQGFLPENGHYVMLSSLKSAVNKFRAIYAFGYDEDRPHTVLGVVEGPVPSPNGLMYKGSVDDGKLKWEANFSVLWSTDSEAKVRVSILVDHEAYLLERVLGRPCFNLAEHWVRDHLVPYLTLYFRDQRSSVLKVSPTLVFSDTGAVKDVVPRALRAMRGVIQGFIAVKGEGIKGVLVLRNGQPYSAELEYDGKSFSNAEALAHMEELDTTAKVMGYVVDTWPTITTLARDVMRSGILNY